MRVCAGVKLWKLGELAQSEAVEDMQGFTGLDAAASIVILSSFKWKGASTLAFALITRDRSLLLPLYTYPWRPSGLSAC
jgi:hypothetical protein